MQGTGVPIVTPFEDEDTVNHAVLAELVHWMETSGVDFFVPCGSTSEAPALTHDERREVIETITNATDLPVIAGTGHEALKPTLEATDVAADAGAEATLVLTPHYFGAPDAGIIRYFQELADRSSLPLYLYSVPPYTGYAMPPDVVSTLATHDRIVGIKDSSGNLTAVQQIISRTATLEFDVLVGSGSTFAASLNAGADGGILALANVVPDLASDIYRSHVTGDIEASRALNQSLVELNEAITTRFGVAGTKAALGLRGYDAGYPRLPLQPLNPGDREIIEDLLNEVNES